MFSQISGTLTRCRKCSFTTQWYLTARLFFRESLMHSLRLPTLDNLTPTRCRVGGCSLLPNYLSMLHQEHLASRPNNLTFWRSVNWPQNTIHCMFLKRSMLEEKNKSSHLPDSRQTKNIEVVLFFTYILKQQTKTPPRNDLGSANRYLYKHEQNEMDFYVLMWKNILDIKWKYAGAEYIHSMIAYYIK